MDNPKYQNLMTGWGVSGYAAAWIDLQLRDILPEQIATLRRAGGNGAAAADALELNMAGIALAAKQYRARLAEYAAENSSTRGTVEPPERLKLAGSKSEVRAITAADAAGLLGVSDSFVRRQLRNGSLAGTWSAGRWILTLEAVEEYQLNKQARSAA